MASSGLEKRNMSPAIAIVGLACRYPDAATPQELWENVLAQRRAFRRIPAERLCLEDYYSAGGRAPDSTYSSEAALIEDWQLDRVHFRVAGRTYRSTDMAHWLALDVASQALDDAGWAGGEGLDRDGTGVLVGNTLTGEFSRAGLMRLRWPYVRRQVAAALADQGWSHESTSVFLTRLEASYKRPFPETTDESLAGGLSNTIAGRICNHFDLHGGGYTVDGACASSLLAVASSCSALVAGDIDVALAGGVDLSLDPFELVGFARTQALAAGEMWVYDRRSAGFLPGEGCGFAVLMRQADAMAQGRRIYALIRGWGVSSDGSGGLTRPEVEGQLHAVRRAYRRAGFGIGTVPLVEGHGTGTAVGDATELAVLGRARREAPDVPLPAAVGSVKGNIGHTKAAAGAAGLLKATLALHHQILPPATGCGEPHAELTREDGVLRVLRRPEPWPEEAPLRASVSAMGFGGINCHLVLEGVAASRRSGFTPAERRLAAAPQDAELLMLAAADTVELARQVAALERRAGGLSRAQVGDLAADLARRRSAERPVTPESDSRPRCRAAVLASGPQQLKTRLALLGEWLNGGVGERLDTAAGVFLSRREVAPRLGLLFPGQGSPAHLNGGVWRRRFAAVDALYERAAFSARDDGVETAIAQPAIATASLAALRVLADLGLEATVAAGHSLGELVAWHWAGAFSAETLLRVAVARGRAMSESGHPAGAMASLGADAPEVRELIAGAGSVQITGYNSPRQTVISGPTPAVKEVLSRARSRGWQARRLAVSHAFHSPLMAAAVPPLAAALEGAETVPPSRRPPGRRVASTIAGGWLEDDADLPALLCHQVTSPVRFAAALEAAAPEVDFFLEAGPGEILTGLARDIVSAPVTALDVGGESLLGLLQAAGQLFALGTPLDPGALFADRFTRPFDLDREPRFLVNPCELAPVAATEERTAEASLPETSHPTAGEGAVQEAPPPGWTPADVVRDLVAEHTELPASALSADSRLLSDLHLSSIAVGELVAEASVRLGLRPPAAPTEYANVTLGQLVQTLEELAQTGESDSVSAELLPAGVDSWVRPFVVELRERPRRGRPRGASAGGRDS